MNDQAASERDSSPAIPLEEQLELLRQRYTAALEQLQQIALAGKAKSAAPATFHMLQGALREVHDCQPVYRAALELWDAQTSVPTATLRTLVYDVQSTLKRLLEVIQQLEERFASSREALLPQLDQATRMHHACNAYAHVGRHEPSPSESE